MRSGWVGGGRGVEDELEVVGGCTSTPRPPAEGEGVGPGRRGDSVGYVSSVCCCCSGRCQWAGRGAASPPWFVAFISDECLGYLASLESHSTCRSPRDFPIKAVLSASKNSLREDGVERRLGETGAKTELMAAFRAER